MLLLLPPSETKRDGGEGAPLRLDALRYPRLAPLRRAAIRAVKALSQDTEATLRALKISARQAGEVERNRTLTTSATMPAIDRYTGVLYDALDAATLVADARERAATDIVIQSALLGPVGGLDEIPAYRLSHDSRIPDLPLKKHWSVDAGRWVSAEHGLVLDLRSEGYAALAPLAPGADRRYLRVVTQAEDGTIRALNHFNKSAKGVLTRAMLTSGADVNSVDDLVAWGSDRGIVLRNGAPGELELIVPAGPWKLDG